MPTVYVNDQPVELGAGEKLNCIQAAQKAGVEIPHYCWHPSLSVVASCRMCLVEVGDKKPDGTVAMVPKVVPGCQTPVKDGTVIVTNSPKVKAAQAGTLEYLLLNHPLDCPVCDQAGECGLQDFSFKYGRAYSRLAEPKNQKVDKPHIGEQITLFTDRCIMCTRCVRFTREISGTAELQVVSRGSGEEIDIFPGNPCNNKLAGNVVDLCPVGALCSKDFLYEQRVWWLKGKNSVCAGCSTGCSIRVDQNKDVVYRLKPRSNPLAQGEFMCDEGRFGWKYIHSEHRLKFPMQKLPGGMSAVSWPQVLPAVKQALVEAAQRAPEKLGVVLSPFMTVEEAYLLSKYVKSLSSGAKLWMTPPRVVGEDDQYPKDLHGNATLNPKFTIRAEKAPNRAGVEAVLKHFGGEVAPIDTALAQVANGAIEAIYLVGGDPEGWITPDQAKPLAKAKLVVVQDLLDSPALPQATFVLPGTSWAERDGTFVNHAGLAQAIHRGLRSPGDAWPDGRIAYELAGRSGMFHSVTIRQEIAGVIPSLAALIVGDLGDEGVFLKSNDEPAGQSPAAANGAVPVAGGSRS
jgi:NADH-quinone oxidoreductase subunit G